ncbi:hypothetical protein BDV39DRAFT_201092 [Aspergillus sergii]|uniref:AttH domain-containing protein n=1 Tax=Aspergillus sergii TaxID=1034303 RepID=A0A5N6XDW7_9EURO|nr:hypothetical protein BDV39DRAFT_201092 [Aspergillus sergii]
MAFNFAGKSRDELAKTYGTDVMSSMFHPTIDDYYRTSIKCGLVYDISWISAVLETEGGKKYLMYRAYQKNNSSKFYLQEVEKGKLPKPINRPHYNGYIYFEKTKNGKIVIRSYDAPEKLQLDIEPGRYRWQEGDDIDITYEAVGPAMRFLTLGGEIKEEIYYTVEMCKIEGTVKGEKVTGFGSLDQVWQEPGNTWHQAKVYLFVEDIWVPFFNKYKDGTYEYGHFIRGRNTWKCGYIHTDGKSTMDNDYQMDVNWKDGNPVDIDINVGPHKLKWVCDNVMVPPESSRPHITYAEGRMVNLNTKKEIEKYYSWIEYRPYNMWHEAAKVGPLS